MDFTLTPNLIPLTGKDGKTKNATAKDMNVVILVTCMLYSYLTVERQYDLPAIMFGDNEFNILPLFVRCGVPTNELIS